MKMRIKNMMSLGKIISFVLVGVMIVYFLLFENREERLNSYYSGITYYGKVIDKFIDKANHNYRIIILDTGDRVSLPPASYELFNKIEMGDTLYKEASTLKGYVRKNQESLIIDYLESVNK